MPKAPDEDRLARLRELYPELSESELEGARYTLGRYIEVGLRVCGSIRSDPERRSRLAAWIESRRESVSARVMDRRSGRSNVEPVPLDELIADTRAASEDLLIDLLACPAALFDLALPAEKRELLFILTKERFVNGKEIEITLALSRSSRSGSGSAVGAAVSCSPTHRKQQDMLTLSVLDSTFERW